MSTLDNILRALELWPEWKKLRATPALVDELQRRIAALEERLQRAPGEACKACGALALRLEKSEQSANVHQEVMGRQDHHWKCQECGHVEVR
jgi:uncharacterized protein with PIN domain